MFGRRPDGRRIGKIDPVVKITPYLMPMRCDAQVFLKYPADMEILSRYIRAQKREKNEKISYMQIILASYVRAVSRNPEVNRFIMNKQLFARNNCSCAFTILKDPNDIDRGEAVVKIRFDLTDTIYDVRDRVDAAIAAVKRLSADVNIPKTCDGLVEADLDQLAADALADACYPGNPREADHDTVKDLFRKIMA